MRLLRLALVLIAAVLCFVAGYKLGQLNPPTPVTAEAVVQEAPIAQLTDTGDQIKVQVTPEPIVTDMAAAQSPLELRAQDTIQTFFDTNGRELIAQVLEVQKDSLKVRRQSDGQELSLPISMLSSDDQAFAAYLWQQQGSKVSAAPSSTSSQSMEDMIWDELFK